MSAAENVARSAAAYHAAERALTESKLALEAALVEMRHGGASLAQIADAAQLTRPGVRKMLLRAGCDTSVVISTSETSA